MDNGRLIVRREVLSHFGAHGSAVFYGMLVPTELSLILSPIPPALWPRSVRIEIHTHKRTGSLAEAARAIADLDLEVISSWSTTATSAGHLCSTSIAVMASAPDAAGCALLAEQLRERVGRSISDLPVFKDHVQPIRVFPLAMLAAYHAVHTDADYHKVDVVHYGIELAGTVSQTDPRAPTLWEQAANANMVSGARLCIVTPDVEEAYLRVCLIAEAVRLSRFTFKAMVAQPSIPEGDAREVLFKGYWRAALEVLQLRKHSIFIASNSLLKREISPPVETAKFFFMTDRSDSTDAGLSDADLERTLSDAFSRALSAVAERAGHKFTGEMGRVSRPTGIGIPCFFACNARPGFAADTAELICKLLESKGFWPVNVDIAQGGESVRNQILGLLSACDHMIVLHCPDENLRQGSTYAPSDWVLFEEVAMTARLFANKGSANIMRIVFSGVRSPTFDDGEVSIHVQTPNGNKLDKGAWPRLERDLIRRLERWLSVARNRSGGNTALPGTETPLVRYDLVGYYHDLNASQFG